MKHLLNKKTLTALLLVFGLCFSSLVFSQSQKKYPTLLWKISGNGLKKNSYLYGTMHVSKKLAYHLSDQFFDDLKSVDVVGLESNPSIWVENMEKYGMFNNLGARGYGGYLGNFYKDAFNINIPNNKIYANMLGFDPDIINGLLYRFNQNKENFEENTYIDLFIYQTAAKWNKNIVSLEDFKTSLVKGKLAEMPDVEEEGKEQDYNYKKYQNIYAVYEKIEDAYRRGDLDDLDSLTKISGKTKNFQKYLLEDRNEIFVHSMDSIFKNQSLFAGVGAAHLPGPKGVIELLRQKGYTVEPVIPKISSKGTKTKDEIEKMTKSVTFSKQFTSDSLFSFSAPGRLVDIANDVSMNFKLHADMANGCYYSVIRLKTFAPIYGYTEAKMKEKMDSLLYENIPGKILTKTEIKSNSGLIGYDITNQTRRGDLQRYNIFITDLELIIFKLGGKGEYLKSNDAKQFFSSIQFNNRVNTFKTFSPPTKGFSVNIPSQYFYDKSNSSQSIGKAEDLYAYDKISQTFFGVMQSYYNDFSNIEEDTFELNVMGNNVLKNFNFKEGVDRKLTSHKGFPCIEISATNKKQQKLCFKIVINGIHYYLVYAIGNDKLNFSNEFFRSFAITDFNYVNTLKVITDRAYAFTAKDELTDNKGNIIDEEVNKEYDKIKKTKNKDERKPTFDYLFQNKYYFSPSSSEHVNIEFEKYNDYDYRDKAEVFKDIKRNMTKNSSMMITNEKVSDEKGIYRMELVFKDTASVRAIKYVNFFKNGVFYALSAPYDTTQGLKGWTKDFIETFAPMDSVIGKNIFENKFKLLLQDLCSNDTAIRSRANTSMASVSFEKVYLNDFLDLVQGKDFSKINDQSRASLLVNGGILGSEKIIPAYKNLYAQYADSSYLQICVIKGLGYLKTQKSYQTILELLGKEPPLVGSETTVDDVFAVFYDSLELCKQFFPTFLNLTHFEEYKLPVYQLLSHMINKKIITSAGYLTQKDNILIEANYELKRFNSTSNSDATSKTNENKALEDLKRSIEDNLRKGTKKTESYDEEGDAGSYRPMIVDYAFLLSPYYKTDPAVKTFFTKLLKTKNNSVLFPVYINLLEQGVNANDTIWKHFSQLKETRISLYNELERVKQTNLFDKKYFSQTLFCEAEILSELESEKSYESAKEKNKVDSIELISIYDAKNKYEKGKIYIFKRVDSKSELQKWAYVFVPETKKAIQTKIDIISTNFYIEKEKKHQEYVNEILNDFYYSHRKRYVSASNYNYSDYGDY